MGLWKLWLENRLEQEGLRKLKEVWQQALQSLGISGLKPTDALATGLSDIEYRLERTPPVKGGTAALKKLNNGQIFDKIKAADTNLTDHVEEAEKWLNKISNDGKAHGATVGDLMQRLFGEKFNELSGDDTPDLGTDAKAEVPAQPPKPDNGLNQDQPDATASDAEGPENEQPPPATPQQATGQPPAQQMGQPQQMMPPPPMGAQQGLF